MSALHRTLRRAVARAEGSAGTRAAPYRLFEVTGLELEYAVVDDALRPRCLVEDAFRHWAGHPVSDIEHGNAGFSNELAAHVFEMKTVLPVRDLADAETVLVEGLRRFAALLRERCGARLLPTGMHPFMRPSETSLWQRSGKAIYETYARLFDIHEHGWLNVQSNQINLPFGSDAETAAMHNAIACVLPYLPALTASSPFVEGQPGPAVDNRMAFYRTNQRRVPVIAGRVVPEYMTSLAQYKRDVLQRIYRALDDVPGGERLQHEWVNSRGAILRFDRSAIEIRVLDLQECVRMDVAVAVFVRAAVKHLTRALLDGRLALPEHACLVADFDAVVDHGSRARVHAPHLVATDAPVEPERVLRRLLEMAHAEAATHEARYLALIEDRIRGGNLSERILAAVARSARGDAERRDAIRRVYEELAQCLDRNEPWVA
jgi:carboxylate-amine ligase